MSIFDKAFFSSAMLVGFGVYLCLLMDSGHSIV